MQLTAEHQGLREMARQFAAARLEEAARERHDHFPWDVYREVAEMGFFGLTAARSLAVPPPIRWLGSSRSSSLPGSA